VTTDPTVGRTLALDAASVLLLYGSRARRCTSRSAGRCCCGCVARRRCLATGLSDALGARGFARHAQAFDARTLVKRPYLRAALCTSAGGDAARRTSRSVAAPWIATAAAATLSSASTTKSVRSRPRSASPTTLSGTRRRSLSRSQRHMNARRFGGSPQAVSIVAVNADLGSGNGAIPRSRYGPTLTRTKIIATLGRVGCGGRYGRWSMQAWTWRVPLAHGSLERALAPCSGVRRVAEEPGAAWASWWTCRAPRSVRRAFPRRRRAGGGRDGHAGAGLGAATSTVRWTTPSCCARHPQRHAALRRRPGGDRGRAWA
jgi:hypothetical protein